MREIKFRAWWQHDKHNPDGAMYGVGAVDWTRPDFGEPERELCQHPTQVALVDYPYEVGTYQKLGWNENCTLMQYTGLKDKNGVEIYEGDIMHIKLDHENCVVELDKDCWVGRWNESQFTTPLRTLIAGGNVVVGNIYENKDLLA